MLSLDPTIIIYAAIAACLVARAASMENRSPWLWGGIAGVAVYCVPYPFPHFWRTFLIVIILFAVMTIQKAISSKR